MDLSLARWGVDRRLLVFALLATALSGLLCAMAFAVGAVLWADDARGLPTAVLLSSLGAIGMAGWSWPRTLPAGLLGWAVGFRLSGRQGPHRQRRVAALTAGLFASAAFLWPWLSISAAFDWPPGRFPAFAAVVTVAVLLASLWSVHLSHGPARPRAVRA